MSYVDPQTINVVGGVTSLPRTGSSSNSGTFTSADGTVELAVSHSRAKRNRSTISLSQVKTSADVLIPSQNVRSQQRVYVVVDRPLNGFTVAESKTMVDSLIAFLTASTGAKVTQLLGFEI